MKHDHHRVTEEGKRLGATMVRLFNLAFDTLSPHGMKDERCASCAFRPGTVPNGCIQTQLDVLKAVAEGTRTFTCHATTQGRKRCFGAVMADVGMEDIPGMREAMKAATAKYDYSPGDTP